LAGGFHRCWAIEPLTTCIAVDVKIADGKLDHRPVPKPTPRERRLGQLPGVTPCVFWQSLRLQQGVLACFDP